MHLALANSGIGPPNLRVVPAVNIADHVGLACAVASSFVKNGPVKDSEEFAECMIALMKAVDSYEPSKGRFSSYARRIMRNRLIDFHRKESRSLEADLLEVDPECERQFDFDFLYSLLEDHPDDSDNDRRNKLVLRQHWIDEVTWKELGSRLGVSQEMARQYGEAAIRLIRKRFNLELSDVA
jgi:RNA polymerase sigma factor (sigma-70 family)